MRASVAKSIPSYLKLHREINERQHEPWPGLNNLCRAFERATGWPLQCVPGEPPADDAGLLWSAPAEGQPAHDRRPRVGLAAGEGESATPPTVELEAAVDLAATIGEMVSELAHTRRALWQREADLAASVPILPHRETPLHLANRLESSLRSAAEAVGAAGAALYLLDETTSWLKLRSAWGLPRDRLLAAPRELSQAAADIEALVGHAIVLTDAEGQQDWQVPEEAGAAICVPVSTPTTPLGTLWVFGREPREYDDRDVNVVEIVAGRLAAELEREVLLASGVEASKLKRELGAAERWQERQLPRTAPLVDGWQIAGWCRPALQVSGDFYDWFVCEDDRLTLAVGSCQPNGLEAALAAAALRASLRAHAVQIHDAGDVLGCVNRGLWTGSVGDQTASMIHAVATPGTGKLAINWAGRPACWRVSTTGIIDLIEPRAMLGLDPDGRFAARDLVLDPGEWLVILGESAATACQRGEHRLNGPDVWEMLRPRLGRSAAALVETLSQRIMACPAAADEDCTLLILKRLR
jgi:phosphoserine phosphatase RsbU/P